MLTPSSSGQDSRFSFLQHGFESRWGHQFYSMKLSIVIPVYNELNSLPVILKKIFNDTPKIEKKIIIVDDFSNDGTREWLRKKNKENNIKIIFKKKK